MADVTLLDEYGPDSLLEKFDTGGVGLGAQRRNTQCGERQDNEAFDPTAIGNSFDGGEESHAVFEAPPS